MIGSWQWLLMLVTRKLWFKSALFSILAVITALIAIVLKPYIPLEISTKIGTEAVDQILGIIASSMLAVTTFSLGTMVASFSSAASNTSPRATTLLIEDATTHSVLATFVGSFLFALVGLVALHTGVYGAEGRVVLFVVTILLIVIVVITLLRWIEHLTKIGRVSHTLDTVERATLEALNSRIEHPYLGCQPLIENLEDNNTSAQVIFLEKAGYITYIDVMRLSTIADEISATISITALPGTFCDSLREVARASVKCSDEQRKQIIACFHTGSSRNFRQDPRFGLCVLAEISSRALSPAINDPGTAINVIGRNYRLLEKWLTSVQERKNTDVQFSNLFAPSLSQDDLFDDAFGPVTRDGANIVEVGIRLQKTLDSLSKLASGTAKMTCHRISQQALKYAEAAIQLESEKQKLKDAAKNLQR